MVNAGRGPWSVTALLRDFGAVEAVLLVQVDADQLGSSVVAGDPAIDDVPAERFDAQLRVLSRLGQACVALLGCGHRGTCSRPGMPQILAVVSICGVSDGGAPLRAAGRFPNAPAQYRLRPRLARLRSLHRDTACLKGMERT